MPLLAHECAPFSVSPSAPGGPAHHMKIDLAANRIKQVGLAVHGNCWSQAVEVVAIHTRLRAGPCSAHWADLPTHRSKSARLGAFGSRAGMLPAGQILLLFKNLIQRSYASYGVGAK